MVFFKNLSNLRHLNERFLLGHSIGFRQQDCFYLRKSQVGIFVNGPDAAALDAIMAPRGELMLALSPRLRSWLLGQT